MSEQVSVFRFKRSWCAFGLYLVLLPLVMVCLGLPLLVPLGLVGGLIDLQGITATPNLVLGVVGSMVIYSGAVYLVAYSWTYRIAFTDSHLARAGLPNPINPRRRIAYADIERVTRGTRGVLKIVPREGPPLPFNVNLFDSRPAELIGEIRRRVGESRFDAGLEASLFRNDPLDGIASALGLLLIALLLLAGGLSALRGPILEHVAWETVIHLQRGFRGQALGFTEDGTLWIAAQPDPSGSSGSIRLYEVSGAGAETMELSLGRFGEPWVGETPRIDSIAIDPLGNPWVAFDAPGGLFYWDGDALQHLPLSRDEHDTVVRSLHLSEGFLFAFEVPDRLLRIDPATAQSGFCGPCSYASRRGDGEFSPVGVTVGNDGTMIIVGRLPSGVPALFLYSEVEAGEGAPLEVDVQPTDSWPPAHVSVDAEGRLYAILQRPGSCVGDVRELTVGVREPDAGGWHWGTVAYAADCEAGSEGESFAVDPRGRVWMQSRVSGVNIVEGSRGGTSGDELVASLKYTETNSGYPGGSLVEGEDGYIYAFDSGRGRLARIDGRATQLPRPLPTWLAALMDNPFTLPLGGLILMLPAFVRFWWVNYRGRD
jgi:hypothetical protein